MGGSPLDIALVGMDGIGKGTIAAALKASLLDAGLNTQLIDLPHYTDLQGISFFQKVSRSSKAWIEEGVRTRDSRKISAGSLLAALTVRTARAMTKRADVRLIVRHPGIEVDALAKIYSKRMASLAKLVAKALGGPMPRVIVLVTGDPQVALQRITADKTRSGEWQVNDFPHETRENLARLNRVYRRTVLGLKRRNGDDLELIEVNGERPVEETTRQIMERLRGLNLLPKTLSARKL